MKLLASGLPKFPRGPCVATRTKVVAIGKVPIGRSKVRSALRALLDQKDDQKVTVDETIRLRHVKDGPLLSTFPRTFTPVLSHKLSYHYNL